MDEDQRTLGVLIEQGRWLSNEMSALRRDVQDIKESHTLLRGKILGVASSVGILGGFISHFVTKYFHLGGQ